MSSDIYVARALADVEMQLHQAGKALKDNDDVPMTTGYRPEMDTSKELDTNHTNYYQGLIGILRWMCELGPISVLANLALLS